METIEKLSRQLTEAKRRQGRRITDHQGGEKVYLARECADSR